MFRSHWDNARAACLKGSREWRRGVRGGNVTVPGEGEVEEESTRRNLKVQESTALLPFGGSRGLGRQVVHHPRDAGDFLDLVDHFEHHLWPEEHELVDGNDGGRVCVRAEPYIVLASMS